MPDHSSRGPPNPVLVLALAVCMIFSYLFIANTSHETVHHNPHKVCLFWDARKIVWGADSLTLKAVVILSGDSGVSGRLTFHQETSDDPVHITGHVSGLDPNSLRGFHVQ